MSHELMTGKEVADLLRVHPNTVLGWARNNKIRSVRVGRAPRFWREDVYASIGGGPEDVPVHPDRAQPGGAPPASPGTLEVTA